MSTVKNGLEAAMTAAVPPEIVRSARYTQA
jgi:hypothetical protein